MQAFPAKCRAALFDFGCDVDQELSRSVNAKKVETIRTLQANYLKFCVDHLVLDPCGDGPSYEFLVAACKKYLTKGIKIKDISLKAATIRFYLLEVNDMFVRRGFRPPFYPYSPENKTYVLLKNYEKLEVIPSNHNPLKMDMIAAMYDYAEVSEKLFFQCAIFDWVFLGRYIGQRLSEFAQTTQNQPD